MTENKRLQPVEGALVLSSGETFEGKFWVPESKKNEDQSGYFGEVVFNTSHSGYEEMATDPSYCDQILVLSASMQGNYGVDPEVWESKQVAIKGFVCLQIQDSKRDQSWIQTLSKNGVPVLSEIDTRLLVKTLRSGGTRWGVITAKESIKEAQKKLMSCESVGDWTKKLSVSEPRLVEGDDDKGSKLVFIDFGYKENILRELKKRCSKILIMGLPVDQTKVKEFQPDAFFLSNGPGDPMKVTGLESLEEFFGELPFYGICMGHQIMARLLGGKTFSLKFGHRGSNHPVKELETGQVYMTSQNHGYAVEPSSLSDKICVTHINLNDQTVSGLRSKENKCLSVQFHPESHPGPHEAAPFFDLIFKDMESL